MKSRLVDLFLIRKYIWLYLFCSFYPGIVAADRGGFLYFKFLCYQNPGNQLLSGKFCGNRFSKICDPSFKICISNQFIKDEIKPESCNVHHQETSYYSDAESVCNGPKDNRAILAGEIIKELSLPLHKSYHVKIEIRNNIWGGISMIATFGAQLTQIPAANMSQVVYLDKIMHREEFRYANPRASLKISMGLQCDHDRFGEYCLGFCKPNSQNILACTKDGGRVCKKGWKGEKCNIVDLCAFVSCIEHGKCLEIDGKADCMCNQQIGPQCFSNYNACLNSPCKNGGICYPKKVGEVGYYCQCKFPFSGPQCTYKNDICESKPCKNNASCHHSKPNVFYCKCLQGFNGTFCELKIVKGSSSNLIKNVTAMLQTPAFYNSPKIASINVYVICSLCFGVLVVILVIVFTTYFVRKRRAKINKKRQYCDEKPMSKKDLERKNNSLRVISNQYLDVPRTETVYEEIDDRDIYGSLLDKTDDYLVPSCVNTLSASQLQIYNSDYLEMSEKYDTYKTQSKEVPVENDSFYLPALPKREPKSKFDLKKILFP